MRRRTGEKRPPGRGLVPALAASALAMLAGAAPAQVDFTHLPALSTPTITDSLMLAVTRAGDRLVAVGERGFIAWSDDDGSTWTQADVPLSVSLTSIAFVDAERGMTGGHEGMLLATSDGGSTWTPRFDGTEATKQEIEFAEARLAEARAALADLPDDEDEMDATLAVEDAQWALEDLSTALEEGPSNPFLTLWFDEAGTGIAAGAYGTLFRSNDFGETWRIAAGGIDNPDKYHYYAIARAGDDALFLVGEAGLLYRSTDNGITWTTLDSPYAGSFFGVLAGTADDGQGYVLAFGLRGNVFRSVDQGEQWTRIDVDTRASITAGTTLEDGRLVLVGNSGVILTSSDDGRSFTVTYQDDRLSLSGVAAAGESHVVVVGAAGIRRVQIR